MPEIKVTKENGGALMNRPEAYFPYPANRDARACANKTESISYWARAQIGPDKGK
jgi:hypothetical protein